MQLINGSQIQSGFCRGQPPARSLACCSADTCFRSSVKKSFPFAILFATHALATKHSEHDHLVNVRLVAHGAVPAFALGAGPEGLYRRALESSAATEAYAKDVSSATRPRTNVLLTVPFDNISIAFDVSRGLGGVPCTSFVALSRPFRSFLDHAFPVDMRSCSSC